MSAVQAGPPRASAEKAKQWFDETVSVPDSFRDLLVDYSHVPADKVDSHVVALVSDSRPLEVNDSADR